MKTPILVAAYLVAIVLANLSVAAWGPSVAIVNAFLFIALDLTSLRCAALRVAGALRRGAWPR